MAYTRRFCVFTFLCEKSLRHRRERGSILSPQIMHYKRFICNENSAEGMDSDEESDIDRQQDNKTEESR